jgi:hypothetical protein
MSYVDVSCMLVGSKTETCRSTYKILYIKVKVKQSRNRPGVAQRVPEGLGSQISMTFGTLKW